jgi:hypothetical protein
MGCNEKNMYFLSIYKQRFDHQYKTDVKGTIRAKWAKNMIRAKQTDENILM